MKLLASPIAQLSLGENLKKTYKKQKTSDYRLAPTPGDLKCPDMAIYTFI